MSDDGEDPVTAGEVADVAYDGGVLTVDIKGTSFGGAEAPVVKKLVQERIDAAGELRAVVLDFTGVTFVNSSGLGACIEVHNVAREKGAEVILYGMREDLCNLVKLTRLDKLFCVVDDADALDAILSGS